MSDSKSDASTELIEKIDKGLSKYYEDLNPDCKYYNPDGVGKFQFFANDNDLDDEIVLEELQDPESTLCDFDSDFPLETAIDDEDEKNAEILRILNLMAQTGQYAKKRQKYKLDVSICSGIDAQYVKSVAEKYETQMSQTMHGPKDDALMYYLAVSTKERFPFLTYIVDCYTEDRATAYDKHKQSISIEEWAAKSKFMQQLKKKYPQLAIKLSQAIANYTKRTLPNLKFTTPFKINDDLKSITEYIVSIPKFIVKLMDIDFRTPPFQVDLLVAVNDVMSMIVSENKEPDMNDEADPYGSVNDAKENDENIDVNKRLSQAPNAYHVIQTPRKLDKDHTMTSVDIITRVIFTEFNKFRYNLKGKDTKFDNKTYPQNRRFCIFVDRTTQLGRVDKKKAMEAITLFHPPDDCNEMEVDHVPEIGFEFVRNCLIPSQNKDEPIAASNAMSAKLLTFMFNVEERDHVRCYVIWNGQSMRFQGQHIAQVLPILFKETEENKLFAEGEKKTKHMQSMFNQAAQDTKFEDVYEQVGLYA
eukprot:170115_1